LEKFTLFQGGGKPDHFKDLVKRFRASMPDLVEHVKLKAELKKANYDALCDAGFTSKQAMQIMKNENE